MRSSRFVAGTIWLLLAVALHLGVNRARADFPAPSLVAPVPGTVLSSMEVPLVWRLPAGTMQYHLQVVPANNDGPAINLIRDAASGFTIPSPPAWYVLLPGMSYSWRIRATETSGAAPEHDPSWGPWSDTWSFRTPAPSNAGIRAVFPANGARLETTAPVILQWNHTDPALFYFEVQVSGDDRFDTDTPTATSFVWWNLVHSGMSTPPYSWPTPHLQTHGTYYWRVRPRVQGDGEAVDWGPVWQFTIAVPPGGPRAATNLQATVECAAAGSASGLARLIWSLSTPPGTEQRVEVTIYSFEAGEVERSEPLPPDQTSLVWDRLRGQAIHFWRVLTLHPEGWVPSVTANFQGPTCVADYAS